MNKKKAIKWCEKNLTFWPRNTKHKTPDKWIWYVTNTPYKRPEYFLGNQDGETITQDEIDFNDNR